jgi:quinol monooxygenase YgiN
VSGPVAVLGFQRGRPGSGAALAALNLELAAALRADGLLDYQPVQHTAEPERVCAYWLWVDWAAREALWQAPPEPLRRFRAAAEPVWADPPAVGRYRWRPGPAPAFCPPDGRVRLLPVPVGAARPEPGTDPAAGPGRLLAADDPAAPSWWWRPAGGQKAGTDTWQPCAPPPGRRPT